jgi:hypothetical protein
MENIRFRNSRVMNWARYHGTSGMQAKFATITKDPVKLSKLGLSKNISVLAAVAGNICTPNFTLGDLSNYDLFQKYFEYHEYENMVLTPLAGNLSAPIPALGRLSNVNSLYNIVRENPKVKKIVELARYSHSPDELTELSACPILHVKHAVAFNSHTP